MSRDDVQRPSPRFGAAVQIVTPLAVEIRPPGSSAGCGHEDVASCLDAMEALGEMTPVDDEGSVRGAPKKWLEASMAPRWKRGRLRQRKTCELR